MTIQAQNLFDRLPANLDDEIFEPILSRDDLRIERIISRGHSSPESGWYDQSQGEWVLVLSGAAVIAYEGGEEVRLCAGSHLDIPPHTRHRVKWTDPDTETIWLAVHYGEIVEE